MSVSENGERLEGVGSGSRPADTGPARGEPGLASDLRAFASVLAVILVAAVAVLVAIAVLT